MNKSAIRKSFERHYHRNEQRATRYAALKKRAATARRLHHDNCRLRRVVVQLQQQVDQARVEPRSEKDRAVKLGAECDRLHAIKTANINKSNDPMVEFVLRTQEWNVEQAVFSALLALVGIVEAKSAVEGYNTVTDRLSWAVTFILNTKPELRSVLLLVCGELGDAMESINGAFSERVGGDLQMILKTPLPLLD